MDAVAAKLAELERRIKDLEGKESPEYLFGTWTPTYVGGTAPGATTYTLQDGRYLRHGNLIIARGVVVWSAATGTGDARISLPFTSETGANAFQSGSLRLTGITFANSAPEMMIDPNTSYFTMDSPLSNNNPTKVAIEAAGNIVFTAVYFKS